MTPEEWRRRWLAIPADVRPLIAGRRVASKSSGTVDCISPADGRHLYSLPEGSADDAADAVLAARAAFESGAWCDLPPLARKSILQGLAERIDGDREVIALQDSMEMGKPISQALGDAFACAHIFRYFAEFADKIFGDTAPTAPRLVQFSRREPRGVVAAIVPWNFPTPNAALKVAPALAAGNCVVLKPSELSSSSALHIAQLAIECGVPPGVFNVVVGLGRTVGAALAAHPGVDFVAFTGSTATGRALMRETGSSGLRPLQLECGGKSANIVLPDCADLSSSARDAAERIFTNQGQLCVAGTRLIAHNSIRQALVDEVLSCARRLRIGDPLDEATTFGPLASRSRMDAVLHHIDGAANDGASLQYGGRQCCADSGGYFVEPTVFDGVTPGMKIAQEDIFGPLLAVMGFETREEAIALANGTPYGLSATVWTQDLKAAHDMIRRLKAGRVTVLAAAPDPSAFAFPMAAEPVGQSGFGAEAGREGIEAYTRLKAVEISL